MRFYYGFPAQMQASGDHIQIIIQLIADRNYMKLVWNGFVIVRSAIFEPDLPSLFRTTVDANGAV